MKNVIHFLRSRFYIWERTCNIYLSQSGLFCLTWQCLVLSIFLQRTKFHFSLWLSNTSLCVYIYIWHIFFMHLSFVEHLAWFYTLATVNNAAINMGVQVSLLYTDLHFFRYVLRSGIAQSYSNYNFLRKPHTDFIECYDLHSHQQCVRFLFPFILASICCCCCFL
jgi:hypothetical protein